MLRQLLISLANKESADRAPRLSVVVNKDEWPQPVKTSEKPKRHPKSICTSLKDLCEI